MLVLLQGAQTSDVARACLVRSVPKRERERLMKMQIAALAALACVAPSALANITTPGYSQNFNGMGATGTSAPALFSIWTLPGDNSTFTDATGIPASAVGGGTQTSPSGALGVFTQNLTTPTNASTNNNGFNFGFSTNTSDRALGTSPTQVGAAVIQAALTNARTTAITSLDISFDVEVVTLRTTANELRGLRFFYSTVGSAGPFTAVPALDVVPSASAVRGSVLAASATVNFPSAIAPGAGLWFRWVDDNADQTSPDQLVALDNLVIVPSPAAIALAGMGGLLCARRKRR